MAKTNDLDAKVQIIDAEIIFYREDDKEYVFVSNHPVNKMLGLL